MAERVSGEPAEGGGRSQQSRFLHLPPLSAAEVEIERESERKLNAVLAEMFGPKENYGDREVDAACAVLDAREQAND
jgi:hypothetical protein